VHRLDLDECPLRFTVAVLPAAVVLVLTLLVSVVTSHPYGLFLAGSIRGVTVRFALITLVLVAPIAVLSWLLALVGYFARTEAFFGRVVKGTVVPHPEFSKVIAWVLRPFQGIGLSMIFAERFSSLLELPVGTLSGGFLVRSVLFATGSALVSLLLSVVWSMDDLGIKIYNRKTGEVHMVGSSVGTVLPLASGIIGVSSLCFKCSLTDALMTLLEIVVVLYPSYVLFVVCHEEFVRRRGAFLSQRLSFIKVETICVG